MDRVIFKFRELTPLVSGDTQKSLAENGERAAPDVSGTAAGNTPYRT